eukprot:NODE_194_length_13294_cov_0.803714.p7 type:complete len:268 gc:universal NODE_194_length_13294_cov_0.803714:6440-7243(+)
MKLIPACSIGVIGDSYSDIGNVLRLTQSQYPNSSYAHGRFSDGLVAAEYMANKHHCELVDYAYGHSTTNSTPALSEEGFYGLKINFTVPSMHAQLDKLLEFTCNSTQFSWTVVQGGFNDYFYAPNITGESVATELLNMADHLTSSSIPFILFTVVDPLLLPYRQSNPLLDPKKPYTDICIKWNESISMVNQGLMASKYGKYVFDINKVIKSILNQFKYTKSTCLSAGIEDCKDYLFFDEYHLTSKAHGYIANSDALKHIIASFGYNK